MTVRELVEELEKCPQDMEVRVHADEGGDYHSPDPSEDIFTNTFKTPRDKETVTAIVIRSG